MMDLNWLTQEAHRLHSYFESAFYAFAALFIVIAVLVEYFNLPLGVTPGVAPIVGRVLVAVILLISYDDVYRIVTDVTDAIAQDLGGVHTFDGVLKTMGKKVDAFEMEWLNTRTLIMTVLSFLTYTFLFYAVLIAEAAYAFSLTLLFVFSPLMIVMFILPTTSGATRGLYRSLFEVSCWKVVWCVLANLLWSSVLVEINTAENMNFIKLILINLMLGGSLVFTPWLVHALTSSGIVGMTRNFSGVMTTAGLLTPGKVLSKVRNTKHTIQKVHTTGSKALKTAARPIKKRINAYQVKKQFNQNS